MRWLRKRNKLQSKIRKWFLDFLQEEENQESNIEGFQKKGEIDHHDESYTKFLDVYAYNTEMNCALKFKLKQWFFAITMGILVAITLLFAVSMWGAFQIVKKVEDINSISLEAILGVVTIIAPSITSLIVAFVKIPEIIAQYLFNIEEESSMNSIIKNIQDYDKDRYNMDADVEGYRMRELEIKKTQPPKKDKEIEDPPERKAE